MLMYQSGYYNNIPDPAVLFAFQSPLVDLVVDGVDCVKDNGGDELIFYELNRDYDGALPSLSDSDVLHYLLYFFCVL